MPDARAPLGHPGLHPHAEQAALVRAHTERKRQATRGPAPAAGGRGGAAAAAASSAATAATDAAHGGVWGLARVVRLEHAGLRMQSTDVARCVHPAGTMARLVSQHAPLAEAEQAWVDDQCYAARLRRSAAEGVPSQQRPSRSSGSYAITGGLGGLGLRAASLLVAHGSHHVLLASRSGRTLAWRAVLPRDSTGDP